MFCNVLLCDSFMVLYFNDFHVKLLFLCWFTLKLNIISLVQNIF
jgi:hypothetical protein